MKLPTNLEELGYTQWKTSPPVYPQTDSVLFQKIVESESICECNENLAITIHGYQFTFNPLPTYTIEIRAKKHGQWWNLASCSLTLEEVEDGLKGIEETLIKLFNAL